MRKLALFAVLAGSAMAATGCARPGEFGYTPAYTTTERGQQIARNWDYEGKQMQDDIDHALLLRPSSHMTVWSVQ